jgi:putative spermidine/putrescine transport system permease protein
VRNLRFAVGLLVTLGLCAFMIVPMGMSMLAGVTANYFIGLRSGLTLTWVVQVLALYWPTIWLSLLIAFTTLAVDIIAGVPAAYVLARSEGTLARVSEELLSLPIAIPGLAIALGLILTYGTLREFRASWLFIVVGHVIFTMPFMIRSVVAVMRSIDLLTLDESAASLGAGFMRRFLGVIVPNSANGILAGALMVFTLSIGEFNITWMLHTPLTKTLPVGLADSYASMRLEVASAYTLIFFVVITPVLVALQRFGAVRVRTR